MICRDELAAGRFACTERERALFEAGIKMGTIYHQFVGTPVNADTVGSLEEGIRSAISVQPYVEDVRIKIDRSRFKKDGDRYCEVQVFYGSSSYTREEMARLIDAVVADCKELGIETKTPDEIADMLSLMDESEPY